LKQAGAVEVSVSAYPERHPQSADWGAEMDALKRKVDAGADRAITQFFFENDVFERYVERVRRAGISIPVTAGVMPIHRFHSICTFASRCGASIPGSLARQFDGLDPDSHTHGFVAAAVAAEQVSDLMRRGFDAFHIYTLNRSELAEAICRFCGLVAEDDRAAA
jgi:methylenetetrahydrofolate reductase (NADPH)